MNERRYMVVIAERGWVYAANVHRDGDMIVLTDCFNVRRWGTSKGLGELALRGPLAETQLDPYGVVKIHVLAVIGSIECSDDAATAFAKLWAKETEPKPKKVRS